MEEVEVTVSPDGKVTVHVRGVPGEACLEKTKELIAVLGGDIEDQELTAEAFIQVEDGQEERQWH